MAVVLLTLAAAPAAAVFVIEDRTSVTFQWTDAVGDDVRGYYVLIQRNGAEPVFHSAVFGTNQVTVSGEFGETVQISTAAFGVSTLPGPLSEASEVVQFVSTAPTNPGGGAGTDPGTGGTDPGAGDPGTGGTGGTDPGAGNPDTGGAGGTGVGDGSVADAVPVFDLDGDGLSDLLLRNQVNGALEVWAIDAGGIAGSWGLDGEGPNATIEGNGDYDGDGTADILWRDAVTRDVTISYMQDGAVRATALLNRSISPKWEIVGNGDYNGDGRDDILLHKAVKNKFRVWMLTKKPYKVWRLRSQFGKAAQVLASGDFDGDGMTDILWRDSASGVSEIWGTSQPTTLGDLEAEGDAWEILGSGDFDGDGSDDLLLRDSSGRLAVRLSTTGTRSEIASTRNQSAGARDIVAIGDYNGDGRSDLVVYDASAGDVRIWFMDRSAMTSSRQIDEPTSNWYFANVDSRPPGSR
ncbi:MAG: FG-GAP repeat domain-containing protein [Myxococcota bacterium]